MLRRRRKNLLYLGNALQLKLVRNVCRVRADGPRPGGREDDSYDPCRAEIRIPRKVLKGGSHLWAPNY